MPTNCIMPIAASAKAAKPDSAVCLGMNGSYHRPSQALAIWQIYGHSQLTDRARQNG